MERLVLIGASGLAREVIAALRDSAAQRVVGVLDDAPELRGTRLAGVPVLGGTNAILDHPDARPLVCVGAGASRERIVDRLAVLGVAAERYATVVDPSVRNPGRCAVGTGSILLSQVAITADATVGSHVVMMPGVTVTHDDIIEDFATIAAGVSLGGGVRIGRAAYLGMNASIRPGIVVGAYSTLGMGAALLRDLPENETWVGIPAQPINYGRREDPPTS
jgi:sugar O-acyltransferase (sialic acid O-acetyltransferase NeuD family)